MTLQTVNLPAYDPEGSYTWVLFVDGVKRRYYVPFDTRQEAERFTRAAQNRHGGAYATPSPKPAMIGKVGKIRVRRLWYVAVRPPRYMKKTA